MEQLVNISSYPAPWGPLWIATTDSGICTISLRDGREAFEKKLRGRVANALILESAGAHEPIHGQLEAYFNGQRRDFLVGLDLRGTSFQMQTWKALMRIPYGETRSYQDIAKRIGSPRAVRAIGQANGKNPVPIIVPCHRVVRANGDLGGFGAGLDLKKYLLGLEQSQAKGGSK
jgi:O-6-methylguanine DNA methyltransferase